MLLSTSIEQEVAGLLVELSVMEQRYQAVLAVVQDGWQVAEVARRLGVSRQSVHAWIVRHEAGGLAALTDRSHRPSSCPHQTPAETEALEAGTGLPAFETWDRICKLYGWSQSFVRPSGS